MSILAEIKICLTGINLSSLTLNVTIVKVFDGAVIDVNNFLFMLIIYMTLTLFFNIGFMLTATRLITWNEIIYDCTDDNDIYIMLVWNLLFFLYLNLILYFFFL